MAQHKHITIPYAPRRAFLPFHNRKQRWASLVVHRRGGKTVAGVNDLQRVALSIDRAFPPPKVAYIAPFYNQAKRVAWGYMKHYADPVPGRVFNESELKVTYPNGAEMRAYGADNPDAMRGDYMDHALCDEFADWAPSVFPLVIRPMLSDYRGGATFIGTPKGHNAFYEQHIAAEADPENWFAMTLKASESGLIDREEMIEARRMMTADQYEQEYECSFEAAILGSYWGKELAEAERNGRMVEELYDRHLPVHTAWDLGVSDSTAIWFFQASGGEIRIIDAYENHGYGLDHYAGVIHSKPYKYGQHFVPHDAKVRELGTGRTRIETLIGMGIKPSLVPDHSLEDGINAGRLTIAACWWDRINCKGALEALKQYQREYDEKVRQFKNKPRHDWTSHYADAFRYLAMAWKQIAPEPLVRREQPKGIMDMTLADALERHAPDRGNRI